MATPRIIGLGGRHAHPDTNIDQLPDLTMHGLPFLNQGDRPACMTDVDTFDAAAGYDLNYKNHPHVDLEQHTANAKAHCAACPWQEPCLTWALGRTEFGVWGGTDDTERRRIRRAARTAVSA